MADYGRRGDGEEDEDYHIRFREDEEMEFFTELALHETERWIQAVTKQSFKYQDDTRKSLENGVLLCELLNGLRPGTIKRINKLPTPLAGLDNINVFLKACKETFRLTYTHLFNPSDLEDLSQRAIADSDQLKAEYDKRLRNVAITIYWLGQQAASQPHVYQGPQLDLTAFSALVNRKHHDIVHQRGDWEAAGATVTSQHHVTPSYGGGSNSSTSRHTRDSSLDGYDKAESVNSLDDTSFEMPMNRYNSASALYNASNSNTRSTKMPNNDSGFEGTGGFYRNSPDLGTGSGPASHRRYSSTDSMDGSSHYSGQSGGHSGGHSRQGSVSDEISYPTRRLSTASPRRQSTSADPLQFIKSKGAQDLAQIAQVQMKVAAESKKEATITRTRDDDIDWQANLSTWKNRRKSQSERSYQLREELEKMEREKEGTSGPALPTKTYSQMQEDRERRKSTSRKFYPIADEEEEEDIFYPTSASRVESSLPSSSDKQNRWTKQENESKDSKTENQNDDNNNKNNRDNTKSHENSYSGSGIRSWRDKSEDEPTTASLLSDRRASRSKLSEKLRSFDEDAEDSGWSSRTAASDQSSRHRRSGASNYGISSSSRSADNGVSPASKDNDISKLDPRQDSSSEETSGTDSVDAKQSSDTSSNVAGSGPSSSSSSYRNYNNPTASSNISNVKLTTRNVGSRTQSKIGSIMRNFEESDSKPAAPKQGYNERVNISARKSAFEVATPQEDPVVSARATNVSSGRIIARSAYPVDDSPGEDESSSGSDDEDEGSAAEEDVQSEDSKAKAEQRQTAFYSARQHNISTNAAQLRPSSSQPLNSAPNTLSANMTSRQEKDDGKNCVEKTIKISQAKNSERGFGFFLTGGADTDQPLAVSKVALGSSADVCDLRLKDEILLVNQQDVTSMTATQVGDIVGRAVTSGNIELHIRREKGEDDFEDDDEDFSSSDEGEEDLASPGYRETQSGGGGETSVMDQLAAERQWLEQQIEQQTDHGERPISDKGEDSDSQVKPQEGPDILKSSHTVTLNVSLNASQSQSNDAPTSNTGNKTDTGATPGAADGWGDGPPPMLRKWQRQRQKEEYTFDSPGGRDISETFRKISLNTAPPKAEDGEADLSASEAPPRGTAQAWDHRHNQWTREQDARRQHDREEDASHAQAQFEEDQAKMKSTYDDALKKAEEKEQERKRQEMEMLQPELDKAQLLEERKAERRARIFNTAAAAARSPSPPPPPPSSVDENQYAHRQHLYGNQFDEQPDPAASQPGGVQSSSLVFHVEPLQLRQHQQTQQQQQSQGFKVMPAPLQQEGVFVIDPRNRQEPSDYSAKPVAFHVNLGAPGHAPSENNTSLLEAERERIRLEELRKMEEKRKIAEEEIKAKEEEEMRKIREKEEELLREKEMLRLERERFLKEQEEFKRLKEQQHQQQQQQQQHPQPQQQWRSQPISSGSKPIGNSVSSHLTPRAQPNSINNSYSDNSSFTPRSNNTSSNALPKWPPVNTNYSNSTAATKPSNNNSYNGSSGNQNQPVIRARGFSREEMLSPSKAHVQQSLSHNDRREWSSPSRDGYQQRQQQYSQQQQPQQQQIHQKHQQHPQSQQQYPHSRQNESPSGERGRSPPSTKRGSQFPVLGDHWLVEEAERRRLAESEGRLHSPNSHPSSSSSVVTGPIQPHPELPNRWRGNKPDQPQQPSGSMPAAIRQTLLLKTANVRGGNGPNDGDVMLPPPPPDPYYGDLAPPPPPHHPYHLSPSSGSPSRSPSRSPSGHRSVSPPGNRSPNYIHPHHHPHQNNHHNQQSHQQQLQQQPQQPQQQQQYRQQIQRQPSPQPPHNYSQHQAPSPYRSPQYHDQPGKQYNDVPPRQVIPPQKTSPPSQPPPHMGGGQNGLPVSGTQLCSYCDNKLGFGAAMVIESLGLFYHVNCFRCCVCHTSLGTGAQGADVRVRANQLHCPDCYSNDEGPTSTQQFYQSRRVRVTDESRYSSYTASGLKFSKV